MTEYTARPVKVTAKRITEVVGSTDKGNDAFILEDGTQFTANDGMIARFPDAGPGDYVVWQEDGYCYLNPKDVFERKYRRDHDSRGGDIIPVLYAGDGRVAYWDSVTGAVRVTPDGEWMKPSDEAQRPGMRTLTAVCVARICHEVNRAYCLAMGDNSQPPWDMAPIWQQESAISGVIFHIGQPDSPPSASHENWMREKVAAGWVYGKVKDPEKREHPCLVPFDQLPKEQQVKDYLFKAVVNAAIEA